MDLVYALKEYNKYAPGEWTVGDTFESLEWYGEEYLKPTYGTLEFYYNKHLENVQKNLYKELRAADYPTIGDQLDLIYHEGIDAWKARILETKTKYPKPE